MKLKFIKQLLSDNRAEMHLDRMVIIMIAFVAGGLLILAIIAALQQYFPSGMNTNIHDYLG